ncbi:VOC family protein [Streptomyces sp. NPDC056716]|uniref:VOC family protein n=1 Tax=unclassified Streptomyces TaxID=2593676 RepID=UPI0036A73339
MDGDGSRTGDRTRTGLEDAQVATRLPAQDLERARRFYADKLGLHPLDERPGGMLYRTGGVEFQVFLSQGRSPGTFTQMSWDVDDIEAVVAELKRRGVVFEEVELPALYGGDRTVDGILEVRGGYVTKGFGGTRGAWFRDSEGNMLSVGEAIP